MALRCRTHVFRLHQFQERSEDARIAPLIANIINIVKRMAAALRKIANFAPIRKTYQFGKALFEDYKGVVVDTIQDSKNRPLKASIYGSAVGFLVYAGFTNPDEQSFRQHLISSYNEMGLVHASVRNPPAYEHICHLNQLDSERVLKPLSLGFVSFVFREDYNAKCGLYASQCEFLQPTYLSYLTERIVDVGFLGKWWIIEKKIKDYDVNPSEWPEDAVKP